MPAFSPAFRGWDHRSRRAGWSLNPQGRLPFSTEVLLTAGTDWVQASDFAYPEEKMIVTHKNYQEIMKEKMSARTGRSLPKDYPYPRTIGILPMSVPSNGQNHRPHLS